MLNEECLWHYGRGYRIIFTIIGRANDRYITSDFQKTYGISEHNNMSCLKYIPPPPNIPNRIN